MRPRFVIAPARLVVIVVALVVVAFVTAHVLTVSAARTLSEQAGEVQRLAARASLFSSIRTDLHRMGLSTTRALDAGDAAVAREDFERGRESMDAHLAELQRIPRLPHEAPLAAELTRALLRARAAIEQRLEFARAGELEAARRIDVTTPIAAAEVALDGAIQTASSRIEVLGAEVALLDRRLKVASPALDAVAAAIALVLVLVARNASREYTRVTEERNRLAEERAHELEMFAGRVAHDLKNPLAALSLRLVTMRSRFGEPRLREELGKAAGSVTRMNAIIDGLLEFARSRGRPEAGAETELAPVVEGLIGDFLADAQKAGASLTVDPIPPVRVACPPGPLSSILGNLVRNAVKYIAEAPGPERTIRVHAAEKDARVRVEVEDTGPGVPRGQERSIFEPFVRANSSDVPGIGLGLATVKRLVDAYGGSVGVERRDRGGSRFWFELPISGTAHAH